MPEQRGPRPSATCHTTTKLPTAQKCGISTGHSDGNQGAGTDSCDGGTVQELMPIKQPVLLAGTSNA